MNEKEAIEIINRVRISNSFTMCQTLDEFIKGLRERYLKMYSIILPNDYISIAELILQIENTIN